MSDTPPPYFTGSHFCPQSLTLRLELPLPPADNQCHRSGRFSRYATAEYRDWLDLAGEILREALGDWQPDTARWWRVEGYLCLGVRDRDAANHTKAALDLLSGSRVARKGDLRRSGEAATPGVILKPGGLWDDDCRVILGYWGPQYLRHPEPRLLLSVVPAKAPLDYRAETVAATKAQREVDRWNARHPVGTLVSVTNPGDGERFRGCRTTSPAIAEDRQAVVYVGGLATDLADVTAERPAVRKTAGKAVA